MMSIIYAFKRNPHTRFPLNISLSDGSGDL